MGLEFGPDEEDYSWAGQTLAMIDAAADQLAAKPRPLRWLHRKLEWQPEAHPLIPDVSKYRSLVHLPAAVYPS
jgi:hypothetical protein